MVLMMFLREVAVLTSILIAAGVPILTTGGGPVDVVRCFKFSISRDPSYVLLEIVDISRG
jgi:hypothetical protein